MKQRWRELPLVARFAAATAFLMAAFVLASALNAQLIILPFALIPLLAGIGILRGHAWSAYGFALYESGQLLVLPLVLFRGMNSSNIIPAAIVIGAVAPLFFLAGRSLARPHQKRGWLWPWIAIFALTTVPLVFIQPFVIPTGAMEDTILIGDRLLVQRFPQPRFARGDIVVFVYPIDRRQTFVKRIVGVPGDRIRISNKVVYLNGAPLHEPYARHKTDYIDSYRDNFPGEPNTHVAEPAQQMLAKDVVNGELVVPQGKYFVLGDNRDSSLDSRYWGFISTADLIGKPVLIYDSEEQPGDAILRSQPTIPRRVRWDRFLKRL